VAKVTGNAEKILQWLSTNGRRSDCLLAQRKWGMSVRQYQRSIDYLRNERGHLIDSDLREIERVVNGVRRSIYIASHQLLERHA
jgi:hypothetical protein